MTSTQTQTSAGQPVKFRIVISADGKLGMFAESGTYTEGVAVTERLLALLSSNMIDIADAGVPEQHRHDEEGEVVLSEAHEMSHSH